MSTIFETHAHYEDDAFDEDREAAIASLPLNNIGIVMNVGSTFDTCVKSVELAKKYDYIYAAVGIHPSEISDFKDENMKWIRETALKNNKVKAIGEIGLDYHWDKDNREEQIKAFQTQLELAKELQLPVIIHSREAAKDTYDTILASGVRNGVIHCFSYSIEEAHKYAELGFYIGLGGAVTFKNAKKARVVAADIPIEQIVLETDCPYMAPEPVRGSRNSSLNIPHIAKMIADIKEMDYDTVIDITYLNACKLYGVNV